MRVETSNFSFFVLLSLGENMLQVDAVRISKEEFFSSARGFLAKASKRTFSALLAREGLFIVLPSFFPLSFPSLVPFA
jgi:hypothetical protein